MEENQSESAPKDASGSRLWRRFNDSYIVRESQYLEWIGGKSWFARLLRGASYLLQIGLFGAVCTYIKYGAHYFFQGWVMSYLWWIGFAVTLGRAVVWYRRSVREKFPFQLIQWLTILAFGLFFYFRDLPDLAKPGFHHHVDEESLRKLITDNPAPVKLANEAVYLYNQNEFSWSYILLCQAVKSRRFDLNQYEAYYIGDLFRIGFQEEASEEIEKAIQLVEMGADHGGVLGTSNTLYYYLDNLDDAKTKMNENEKASIKQLYRTVNASYFKSLTNTTK